MFLHETDLFIDAINQTQKRLQIPADIVEKDYYVTLVLALIMKECPFLVFKGGTSLSKCFHAIERFSEDIDLGSQNHLSQGQRHQVKQAILNAIAILGLSLTNGEQIHSRRDYNRYLIHFNPKAVFRSIQPRVVIETFFAIPTFPTQEGNVQSMMSETLVTLGQNELVKSWGLEAFPISVQTLERTLIDKVFALCDNSLSKNLNEHSRHLYDIHRLWGLVNREELQRLIPLVRDQRRQDFPNCPSSKVGMDVSKLLKEIIASDVFREDYEQITVQLLYQPLSYETALQTLRLISEMALF